VPGGLSNSVAGIVGGADRYAGIAGDSSGNVYVADPGWGRVVKLGPAGALPATGGGNGTPRLDNCYQGPPVNQRTEPSAVGAPPSGARSLGPGWFLPRRLNPLAQRSARLGFSCSDPCGATLRGTLIAGRKRFVLKPAHRTIYQAGTASLTLRIPRRAITIARRSLRRGRRVTLALRLNVKSFETGLSYRSAARLRLTRNGARIAAAGDQRVIAMRRR
jgi:hypothetical protein